MSKRKETKPLTADWVLSKLAAGEGSDEFAQMRSPTDLEIKEAVHGLFGRLMDAIDDWAAEHPYRRRTFFTALPATDLRGGTLDRPCGLRAFAAAAVYQLNHELEANMNAPTCYTRGPSLDDLRYYKAADEASTPKPFVCHDARVAPDRTERLIELLQRGLKQLRAPDDPDKSEDENDDEAQAICDLLGSVVDAALTTPIAKVFGVCEQCLDHHPTLNLGAIP